MKHFAVFALAIAASSLVPAQQQATTIRANAGVVAVSDVPNLSIEKLGISDLIGISVYDSPELSHNVRVDSEGNIRLPMVKQHIQAAGLIPADLEKAIETALVDEKVMVDPIVTVAVVEYHSRPITVVGAVRVPTTFQSDGTVTLLEAIIRAGGLTENAGSEILVNHPTFRAGGGSTSLTERVKVRDLQDVTNPASNMILEGGENIRVPPAGQVFVAGNVRRPGPFMITNDSESSVLRALAIAGGLDSFTSKTAYIYRTDETTGRKAQIPIEIKNIVARKSPDVPLYGDDMLYIPSANGQRTTAKVAAIATGVGLGVASFLIFVVR